MTASRPPQSSTKHLHDPEGVALHRSGAVARMLGMPVATLRVWERRYGLVQPELSPGGQRLYCADDVRRLAMLKQLTDLGHAIGSLAPLDMAQLRRVAATHEHVRATTQKVGRPAPASGPPAWRVAVIGAALGNRLRRPDLMRRLGGAVLLVGPFADAEHAAEALHGSAIDALLIQEPQLHKDWLATFDAAAPALAAVPKAVFYGFAAESVCEALATAGAALLREPQSDTVLAQWLSGLSTAARGSKHTAPDRALSIEPMPPRRWEDEALVSFADQSTTVACECPRHVAELLIQLSRFEAYSAECEQRSEADADLHAYLRQAASVSRVRFEAVLEHVALHEGLMVPR